MSSLKFFLTVTYINIYILLAMLGLQLLWGAFPSCNVSGSHCSGFTRRAWALGCTGFALQHKGFIRFSFWALGAGSKLVGSWLSCSGAYGIFPNRNQVDSFALGYREVQVEFYYTVGPLYPTGSTSLDSNNLILKIRMCVCVYLIKSFKKQNLNLPCRQLFG